MVRKLNLIIIVLISMFLMPLPVYARGGGHGGFGGHNGFGHGGFHAGHFDHGHFHHHHHEHFEEDFLFASGLFLGFDLAAIIPLAVYPYYYPPCCDYYPYYEYPYGQPYGDLEILVTPEDAEIYVDGRFIGKAKDFSGPTMVSVASGTHIVEFRYNGLSSSTSVTVAPDSKSVVQQHFSNNPKNSV
jgi:PEGA domain-containing protein